MVVQFPKMFKLVLLVSLVSSCYGMSMSAKSSKTMTLTSPDGAKKMFMAHASKSDLDGSASGYIYQSDGKNPAMIVQLGESHYIEPHDFTQFMNHGYETFLQPVKVEPVKFEHFGGHFGGEHFGGGHHGGGHHVAGFGGHHFGGEGAGHGGGHEEKYLQEKGEESNEEFHHGGGEEGGKGFKDFEEFNEELLKKLIDDHESGFDKHAGGEKKKHFEEDEKYEEHHEDKKGEEGENFGSKKSHKKGHKTTGFHNIYHKDEFKKQHSFYDEDDDSGHFDKFGKHYESHGKEGGAHKKGSHLNSGHHSDEFLKKGDFNKGNFQSAAKGFHEAEGKNSHFANHDEHGNKGGKHFHKGFGFGEHFEHGGHKH